MCSIREDLVKNVCDYVTFNNTFIYLKKIFEQLESLLRSIMDAYEQYIYDNDNIKINACNL